MKPWDELPEHEQVYWISDLVRIPDVEIAEVGWPERDYLVLQHVREQWEQPGHEFEGRLHYKIKRIIASRAISAAWKFLSPATDYLIAFLEFYQPGDYCRAAYELLNGGGNGS